MSVEVILPAKFVSGDWGIPAVCVRHGEPAAGRKAVRFVSYTSPWFLIVGVVVYFVVALVSRRTVVAPAWPFCVRCANERISRAVVGWGGMGVGVLLWVHGRLVGLPAPVEAAVGFVVFGAGIMFAVTGTWRAVAGGRVAGNGVVVRFRRAHEAFAARAVAAQRAAAEYHISA